MHPSSIQSFAIFDLETNGLPAHNFNRVAITELSIYGIAAKDLLDGPGFSSLGTPTKIPKKPRILHKLNLLFNPQMVIAPEAERITGLDNYMLEHETPFNKNAGNLVLNFLQHLKQPVCLVAHNGWNFDMPILKKLLEKVEVHLPVTTMCVDSFAAFKEIDSNLENTEALSKRMPVEEPETLTENIVETTDVAKEECDGNKSPKNESETIIDLTDSDKTLLLEIEQVLADNDKIDWRAINETTPKRPIKQSRLKRKSDEDEAAVDDVEGTTRKKRFDLTLKSRRSLDYSRKPKGYYTLSSVYQRVFGEPFADAHHAEADVDALMKIMQYYAQDFVDFANLCARPYAEVLNVGARWQNF